MRKVLLTAAVLLLAVAIVNPAFAASRGSRFVPMGEEPLAQFPLTQAIGISGDGEVALVCFGFLGCAPAVWSEGAVAQFDSYTVSEGNNGGIPAISDSYEVLMTPASLFGAAGGINGIWDGVGFPDAGYDTILPLAPGHSYCGNSGQSTYDISSDGQWATGLTWIDLDNSGNGCAPGEPAGFLWDRAAGTTTALDNSVNNDSTRGNAINADGSVIVGWGQTTQREAMKWVNGVQSFICPDPNALGGGDFCPEGWDVSDDGQTILTSHADVNAGEFTANAAIIQGTTITKMDPPAFPGDPSFDSWAPRKIRADGGAVVGSYGGSGFFGSPPYPVLWQPDLGTIDLQVMMLGQGHDDLFFWFLSSANAISDDGTQIVGSGINPQGWVEAYLIDISKVKVCHKPDGNPRTITIAWGSVGDHMAHGDDLSTCEFAEANGRSRAADRLLRGLTSSSDANSNSLSGTSAQASRLEAVGGNSYTGALPKWIPTTRTPEAGRMTPAEREGRIRQLAERVRSR